MIRPLLLLLLLCSCWLCACANSTQVAAPVALVSFENGKSGSAIILPPDTSGSRILVSAHELEDGGAIPRSGSCVINGTLSEFTVLASGGTEEGAYAELSVSVSLPVYPAELYDFDRTIEPGEEIVVAGFPARPVSAGGEFRQVYAVEHGRAFLRPRNSTISDTRVQLISLSANRPRGLSGGAALVWDEQLETFVVVGGYYGHCVWLVTKDGTNLLGHAIYRPPSTLLN